jgi:hypothetical protein
MRSASASSSSARDGARDGLVTLAGACGDFARGGCDARGLCGACDGRGATERRAVLGGAGGGRTVEGGPATDGCS